MFGGSSYRFPSLPQIDHGESLDALLGGASGCSLFVDAEAAGESDT
jgi:hypothetical protein